MTIYETQAQREERIERESRARPHRKQRSRNRARATSVRREVMVRANQACETCCFSFWAVLVVHHIIPVQLGGSAHRSNLIVLCPNCHALIHHYSHHRSPEKHEGWIKGLTAIGLTEEQASRVLLVASKEAVVNDDGSITHCEDPSLTTRYILIDEPTVGEN